MDSILTSIKKMLGISEEYTHFDDDIIMHINSVFLSLTQLGVGPSNGFVISDASSTWDDFLSGDSSHEYLKPEHIKTYVYQKVRLIFDPPLGSAVSDALKHMIAEFEWRINVAAETTK